jgi:hypothetical protein
MRQRAIPHRNHRRADIRRSSTQSAHAVASRDRDANQRIRGLQSNRESKKPQILPSDSIGRHLHLHLIRIHRTIDEARRYKRDGLIVDNERE